MFERDEREKAGKNMKGLFIRQQEHGPDCFRIKGMMRTVKGPLYIGLQRCPRIGVCVCVCVCACV